MLNRTDGRQGKRTHSSNGGGLTLDEMHFGLETIQPINLNNVQRSLSSALR